MYSAPYINVLHGVCFCSFSQVFYILCAHIQGDIDFILHSDLLILRVYIQNKEKCITRQHESGIQYDIEATKITQNIYIFKRHFKEDLNLEINL